MTARQTIVIAKSKISNEVFTVPKTYRDIRGIRCILTRKQLFRSALGPRRPVPLLLRRARQLIPLCAFDDSQ